MAVTNLQVLDIIEVMEAFLERKRPPEHIRPKLDIGYKIEGCPGGKGKNTVRSAW
jgi:hypothetical protein